MRRYPPGSFMEFGNREGDIAASRVLRSWVPNAPIVETGTHRGYMTKRLAVLTQPSSFVTIETDATCVAHARQSLPTSVQVMHGCSVPLQQAFAFMRDDEWLMFPERFPDIYADAPDADLASVYWKELRGELFSSPSVFISWEREDLLRKYLLAVRDQCPLVVLDSAGGIGYLEFLIAREVMGERPVAYLLDDVRHVKHARSLADLQEDQHFDVYVSAGAHAWALATSRER